MLQQALNRHSMIAIPPETKFFSSFVGHNRRWQGRRIARINSELKINLTLPIGGVSDEQSAAALFDAMADEYLCRLGKPKTAYFGEKTPMHCGFVPRIKRFYPNAKFIWIYRDGRDVALSLSKVPWMNLTSVGCFLVWLFYYGKQVAAAKDPMLDIYFVKYEAIVTNPREQLAKIQSFLGLPPEPAVAGGYGNHEGIVSWEHSWKGMALEPISDARVGRWQMHLPSGQAEFLDWLGGPALRQLGYQVKPLGFKLRHVVYLLVALFDLVRLCLRVPMGEIVDQFFGRAFGSE
jgi:hypothetical protein